ncbi:Cof-type HAD-IIB family hydrolase [Ancylothrix sp. C2]|uniref:HAD-IIB family hydrolase n=1 Tax=Ancylothrix sp. D3o TaxID=2953691 RepID=UPI0021BB4A1B|nr:HAD family hydrolase [Ancylothrix sp. D3o]MCT7952027.1 Cof-type HAD-IIB family hydrolase [Ancylothrix sp. D3o]
MELLSLSQAVAEGLFTEICLVATDMDGTLTQKGKFNSALLWALENLASAGIQVVIVTGRSAGWVSGISSLMPVAGAIAENGGLFFPQGSDVPVCLSAIENFTLHRQQLATAFESLKSHFPNIQESGDNVFRLTDWTFDVAGLRQNDLDKLASLCYQIGWGFTYSSVQCHIKPQVQDKAAGLLRVLREFFPQIPAQKVVTVGDSPNDESLFNSANFPVSVGVANVLEYADKLIYKPVCVTTAAEGAGFCELANQLLGCKS